MRIGVLGAGQLGRMLALAGYPLGFDFVFFDPDPTACASGLGRHICAGFGDEAALASFAAQIDIATYEFENVPVDSAKFVARRVPLRPGPGALAAGQDRLHEKQMFERLGIPVARHAVVDSLAQLDSAAAYTGLPAILKTRRLGYDGKGQMRLQNAGEFGAAWARLGPGPLILEGLVGFEREVSCLAVRAANGETAFYPLAENVHRAGILHSSRPLPAEPLQATAETYAQRLLQQLDYVGVLAVEFFVAQDRLVANEIAPRVHNSGHWSIEGADTSQFENHLRAIAGLPLGSTGLRGASVMLNLVSSVPDLNALAAFSDLHVHLYGKAAKPGRKLGHLTLTASDSVELGPTLARLEAFLDDLKNFNLSKTTT